VEYFTYGQGGSMQLSDGAFALIATLMGASGLKIVEYMLSRSKTKAELDSIYRSDLRKDMEDLRLLYKDLKEENTVLENKVDEWREKYFQLLQKFYDIKQKDE
jgi:hypothetical protein